MAVKIPSGAVRQPDGGISVDEDGAISASLSWKGDYDDLAALVASIPTGDELTADDLPFSAVVRNAALRRVNADLGVLTVEVKGVSATVSTQGGGSSTYPIRDQWSLKSVRNDVSVLAYCSESPSGPNRAAIERWMREPDPALASNFKYRDADGNEVDIAEDPMTTNSVDLIRKLMKGTERVIRFYPQITRRRLYYNPPADAFGGLSYVDTPPYSAASGRLAPDGISAVISAHEWLKVQDDCDEQQDGKWMRTESWIGILKDDSGEQHAWDWDLYGPSRWKMPHDASDASDQNDQNDQNDQS